MTILGELLLGIGSALGATILWRLTLAVARWGRSVLLYHQLVHIELVKLRGDIRKSNDRVDQRFGLVDERQDRLERRTLGLERLRNHG